MVVKDDSLTKLYYSIGEVAEMFGVSKSLVRYWESEFPSLKPSKNSKGDRRFTKENIQQLRIIYDLVKERGFTLDGAKKEIKNKRKLFTQKEDIRNKLSQIKKGLLKLKSELGIT